MSWCVCVCVLCYVVRGAIMVVLFCVWLLSLLGRVVRGAIVGVVFCSVCDCRCWVVRCGVYVCVVSFAALLVLLKFP